MFIIRKEIMIGGVKPINYNSTSLWYYGNVSQNSNFYIIKNNIMDIAVFIVKGTKESKEFEEWLKEEGNKNNNMADDKAIELLLPYLTLKEFKNVVDKIKKESFELGYEKAQSDMRKVLGL